MTFKQLAAPAVLYPLFIATHLDPVLSAAKRGDKENAIRVDNFNVKLIIEDAHWIFTFLIPFKIN